MPQVIATNLNDLKAETFDQLWHEALRNTSPIDELLELARDLRDLEHRYNLSSDEFAAKFKRGEMGDDMDFFDWIGTYELYQSTKKFIEVALMRAALAYARQQVHSSITALNSNESHRIPA